MVAWYAGSGECRDDQCVRLIFISGEGRQTESPLQLQPGTGNPVLWSLNDAPVLLYSKFETQESALVDRWKHCTLWLQRLALDGVSVQLVGSPKLLANRYAHLLGRCSPIKVGTRWFLPLYDEAAYRPLLLQGDGWNFWPLTHFGLRGMIQPTLWEHEGKLYALCRNIGVRRDVLACSSVDGHRWSDPVKTAIPNVNNSLHALAGWQNADWLVWNNSTAGRYKLTLGTLDVRSRPLGDSWTVVANPKQVLEIAHGSYPSLCTDQEGCLHIVYTDPERAICHRRFPA